ncbi:MAG: hypothetical protein MI739_03430 [Bacteroidales bacterium]|nr:hypothetical protein [Bacteroidales bacterium]
MRKFIFIFSFICLFASCSKKENIPITPMINYSDFIVRYESTSLGQQLTGVLSFTFTDGDGDIGFFENSDTTNNHSDIIYDLIIYEYRKQNGQFVINDTIRYWMPYFEKGIYKQSIKGSIDVKLIRTIHSIDTAQYRFFIKDRGNNQSNVEQTPEIIYSDQVQQ